MASSVPRNNLYFGAALCLALLSLFPSPSQADNATAIVAAAIQCFNNPAVFTSCQTQFTPTSNPVVAFCSSACLAQSKLLLNCVNGILINFNFYTPTTIQTIDTAIKAFCAVSSGASAPPAKSPAVAPKLAPSPSKASPAPAPKPSGGIHLRPHYLVPAISTVGLLMFMVLP